MSKLLLRIRNVKQRLTVHNAQISETILAIFIAFSGCPAQAAELGFTEVAFDVGIDAEFSASIQPFPEYIAGGAVADFNKDGWMDIFACRGGMFGEPDYLFINDGDGTFTNRATEWGLNLAHRGLGATVGDVNNDGWPDLFVTTATVWDFPELESLLYLNNRDNTFSQVTAAAGLDEIGPTRSMHTGSCFGDYDLDGDLDLFVCGFTGVDVNRLFRNEGDGTFTDRSADLMWAGTATVMAGFAPRFLDMNNDRYPELLIAADFGTSHYMANNGDGVFINLTASSGTSLETDGMGQTIGDFNGDGLPDWYVTSIYTKPCVGNTLYLNQGDHQYQEVACELGVENGGYGWGAIAVDFDHDGLLDLATTNLSSQPTKVWLQNDEGSFDLFTEIDEENGRGMANLDFDNDGDQDFVIFNNGQPLEVYRNDLRGLDTNWLRILLDTAATTNVAPDGYGSKITLTIEGESQTRWISPGDNYLSCSEATAHFGLASATIADELRIDWPDGETTVLADIAVNQTLTVVYDGGITEPADLDEDGTVGPSDLAELLGNWGRCPNRKVDDACPADLNGDGVVGPADLALLLGNWS